MGYGSKCNFKDALARGFYLQHAKRASGSVTVEGFTGARTELKDSKLKDVDQNTECSSVTTLCILRCDVF